MSQRPGLDPRSSLRRDIHDCGGEVDASFDGELQACRGYRLGWRRAFTASATCRMASSDGLKPWSAAAGQVFLQVRARLVAWRMRWKLRAAGVDSPEAPPSSAERRYRRASPGTTPIKVVDRADESRRGSSKAAPRIGFMPGSPDPARHRDRRPLRRRERRGASMLIAVSRDENTAPLQHRPGRETGDLETRRLH